MTVHIIDCDAAPFCHHGWGIEEHRKDGQIVWDATRVQLHCSGEQKGGRIKGHALREELKNRPVLNANVLDYLLKNPYLIPDDWKGKRVFFWGTIYRNPEGFLYVRSLCWKDGKMDGYWRWGYYHLNWKDGKWKERSCSLDDDLSDQSPAAMLCA